MGHSQKISVEIQRGETDKQINWIKVTHSKTVSHGCSLTVLNGVWNLEKPLWGKKSIELQFQFRTFLLNDSLLI